MVSAERVHDDEVRVPANEALVGWRVYAPGVADEEHVPMVTANNQSVRRSNVKPKVLNRLWLWVVNCYYEQKFRNPKMDLDTKVEKSTIS